MELKPLSRDAVGRALEKAERYRLLGEPFFAESICLDILALEPANQAALVTYVLALADQFRSHDRGMSRARAAIAQLENEYERHYYLGLLHERRAVAYLDSHAIGVKEAAWESIAEAMDAYEEALALRPPGNDDAILRWNTCVRLIDAHDLSEPTRTPSEYPLE